MRKDLSCHVHCSKYLREQSFSHCVNTRDGSPNTLLITFKRAKFLRLCLHYAIPATDLTINRVILFERVKVMTAIALIHLCFGGDSPLNYVKNKVLLNFWGHNCIIKQNDSTKPDCNLEAIFSQSIYNYTVCFYKSGPLNILSSVVEMTIAVIAVWGRFDPISRNFKARLATVITIIGMCY